MFQTEREREREREKERDILRETQTDRESHIQTNKYIGRHRQRERKWQGERE